MLEGSKILRETYNGNVLVPLYDNEDSVCGIIYNTVPYYFQKNLQGDIIAITDSNGNTVARYSYDAWGVCTIVQDTTVVGIAAINPFRYRGCYYDSEIGMYYLQSRYYNPAVGRFINADEVSIICMSPLKVLGYNIYAYCNNSVVNDDDNEGLFSLKDITNFISKIANGIKKRLFDYFKSLFNISWRKISINTDVFAVSFNIVIGLILRHYIIKAFNCGLSFFKNVYLAKHTGKAVSIMKSIVNFLLNSGLGKAIINILARIVVWKAGLKANIIGTIAGGMLNDFVSSINKLAGKAMIVVSAFSSIGNILAFVFCDLPDGNIDGKLTIVW